MRVKPEELIAQGYYVTSRKYRHASRLDRPDWREHMAIRHTPWSLREGLEWVAALGDSAADHYRRVYSKDTILVSDEMAKTSEYNSRYGSDEYREKL